MRTRDEHLFGPGPKRILSLDGGGVRGLLTLGVLKRVEAILAARSPAPAQFRLSDYFDLIGGTSTGGILATLFALGKSVDEVTELYFAMCPRIFGWRSLLSRIYLRDRFKAANFRAVIDEVFDKVVHENGRSDLLAPDKRSQHPAIDTDMLRTGLAIFAKRIDTSSLWVMTNNPRSMYWDPQSEHWRRHFVERQETFLPNRDYSLRAIVQATASAPLYLAPVDVQISPGVWGLFLDGGVSHCNNPSLELFYMAALQPFEGADGDKPLSPFGFSWKTGADDLYMLSVGTGTWRERRSSRELKSKTPLVGAVAALQSIMGDADRNAVALMQAISQTPGAASGSSGYLEDLRGLRIVQQPLLTYKRAAPQLESEWLQKSFASQFEVSARRLARLRDFDNSRKKNLGLLHAIGLASGEKLIGETDLPPAFDLPEWKRAAAA